MRCERSSRGGEGGRPGVLRGRRFVRCAGWFAAIVLWLLGGIEFARAAAQLLVLTSFSGFTASAEESRVWQSPVFTSRAAFSELVVSWNVSTNAAFAVEAQVLQESEWGRWWHLGHWSADTNRAPRTSVNGQRDATGRVATDTLELARPAGSVRLRLTWVRGGPADLQLLALAFWAPGEAGTGANRKPARVIEVPRHTQTVFPEGTQSWCSPTSTSMLLTHWAAVLGRPGLVFDGRAVARGVHDPGWSGTGNWPFNTAFAGQQGGLRACVARLNGLSDLEALIGAGIPVAASIAYSMAKGGTEPQPDDGHLVVVCGFNESGDVVVNDPGVRQERVRRVFAWQDFLRAWSNSHRTAYLVWPADRDLPESPSRTWNR
jgi:hypothetical protein